MDIPSFIFYCVIITFTPGPTNIVILSTVHNFGVNQAVRYTIGASLAFLVLLLISASLNTALINVIPKVLIYMKIVGTLYMLYLTYQILKMDSGHSASKSSGSFTNGFIMQFLNPKVVIFAVTVIPSFVLDYYQDQWTVFLFAILISAIGILAFVAWLFFGALLKNVLEKYSRLANIIMALGLIYATIMIWL